MDETPKKKIDESWKEQAEREKHAPPHKQPTPGQPTPGQPTPGQPTPRQPTPGQPTPGQPTPGQPTLAAEEEGITGPEGVPQARFDLFISGLAMEALIALGEMAHPATHKQSLNLGQAKYLIDLLGILEQKTAGNLSVDEEKLLKDTLYQLRMRYLAKGGG